MCYTITMQRKRGLDIYMKRSNSDMNKFTAAALPLAMTAALAAAPIHTAPAAYPGQGVFTQYDAD